MTEIEMFGHSVFIDNITITGKDKLSVDICKNSIMMLGQLGQASNETMLVNMAVQSFDAKIIKGDYFTIAKQDEEYLY